MDELRDLDTRCASVQSALEKEKSRNAELVTELKHVKSEKTEVKK